MTQFAYVKCLWVVCFFFLGHLGFFTLIFLTCEVLFMKSALISTNFEKSQREFNFILFSVSHDIFRLIFFIAVP